MDYFSRTTLDPNVAGKTTVCWLAHRLLPLALLAVVRYILLEAGCRGLSIESFIPPELSNLFLFTTDSSTGVGARAYDILLKRSCGVKIRLVCTRLVNLLAECGRRFRG